MSPTLRLTVAVPTYRRAERLAATAQPVLAQLRALTSVDGVPLSGEFLLVDNDAAASAAAVAASLAAADVHYVVEATPGIVAARNRALDECADRDVLVFIDDDETPRDGWLHELVHTYLLTRPAAVAGRVVSCFDPAAVEPWVAAGNFFDRPTWPTGTEVAVAATGNLLLDIAQLRAKEVRFDERLGLSGGEDSLLTSLLTRRGGRIVFCAESVAEDVVVPERLTRQWILRRAVSAGSVRVRVAVLLAESPHERRRAYAVGFATGALRIVGGLARVLVGVLTASTTRRARGARTARRGVGMVQAAVGRHTEEYLRG